MKKHLLILSTLVLVSGKIFAASGVYFDNQSGITLEGKIDKFTDSEWVKVNSGEKKFLPSGSGSRKIHWKTLGSTKIEPIFYSTKDSYTLPDTITIKDNGKKYDITSGVAKKTVLNLTPNWTQKTRGTMEKESSTENKTLIDTLNAAGNKIANFVGGVVSAVSELESTIFKPKSDLDAKVEREALEKSRTKIEGERMEANREINKAINSKDAKVKAELKTLKDNLKEIDAQDKKIYEKIKKLEKDFPKVKKSQTGAKEDTATKYLQDKIAEYDKKIADIKNAQIRENKPKKYSFWLAIYTTLRDEDIKILEKAKKII